MLAISFILGIAIGSFLNVCILRIPKEQAITFTRSQCPNCLTTLQPLDLIPLFSYLLLAGKCRYCKKPIAFRYFLVELITGLIFVIGAANFEIMQNPLNAIVFIAFSCVMIIVFFIDIDHCIIPDRFSIGLIVAGLLLSFTGFYPLNSEKLYIGLIENNYLFFANSLLAVIIAGAIFFVIFWASNKYYAKQGIEAFGFGDVKLAAGIAAFLGWKLAVFMLFFSFFIGALISLPFMMINKKKLK
ncbi:MAG TPA: prepilin peptidase, partial [bacterium]|nr:prepilin peptidase [bacterium]